jgi:Fe-S cluster biosynthesis and repair protein YggX
VDIDTRIGQFKNMVEADPDNEMGHFSLGRAYFEAERFSDAQPCFRRVLELNPTHSKSYEFLGQVLLKLDRQTDAIDVFKNGYEVAADRGDVMPRDNIRQFLVDLGESVPTVVAADDGVSTDVATDSSASGFRCSRCGRPDQQVQKPPFKGSLGQIVHERVCQQCWKEWIGMGTKVINEMGLALADPRSQEVYDEHMKEFLQIDG